MFTARAVLTATMLGGPVSGSLMIARNLMQINRKKAAAISIFLGILSVPVLSAILLFTVNLPIPMGMAWRNEIDILFLGSALLKLPVTVVFYFIMKPLPQGKINRASIWDTARFTFIGFITFPVSLGVLVNVTGTLFILSFYFSLYIYSRAKKAYQGKPARIFFVFIFLIPFISFAPAMHEYNRTGPGSHVFLFLFYYSLVVMLYLFLFTLSIDVILLINRWFKFIPEALVKNKISGKLCVYAVIFSVGALIVYGHYNAVNLRIQRYHIQVPKGQTKLKQLKIAAAADFHLSNLSSEHYVKNIVEKINSLDPDLVVIAGDIINKGSFAIDWKKYDADFRKIKSRYGVYAVIGNHDLRGDPGKSIDYLERCNIRLLRDKVVNIDHLFYLLGRDDKSEDQREPTEEIMKTVKNNLPIIMIEHRISDMDALIDKGINVHISGHTHYGQLFPVNVLINLVYRVSWGYKRYGNTHFFVTCGVGTWGPLVRLGSFSEIMEINITFK